MKKKIPTICNTVSLVLVIAFAVQCIADYSQYNATLNSAPFSLWVWVNALFFLLPAAAVFAVGLFVRKRQKQIIYGEQENGQL